MGRRITNPWRLLSGLRSEGYRDPNGYKPVGARRFGVTLFLAVAASAIVLLAGTYFFGLHFPPAAYAMIWSFSAIVALWTALFPNKRLAKSDSDRSPRTQRLLLWLEALMAVALAAFYFREWLVVR